MIQTSPKVRPYHHIIEWLTSLLISAGVASSWRGAWVLTDAYLTPGHPLHSVMYSLLLGSIGCFILVAPHPALISWAARTRSRSRSAESENSPPTHPEHQHRLSQLWFADALYSYLSLWVSVLAWRGVWYAWDRAFGIGFDPRPPGDVGHSGIISHAAGVLLLAVLGGLRNNAGAPMVVASDGDPVFGAGGWTYTLGWLQRGTLGVDSDEVEGCDGDGCAEASRYGTAGDKEMEEKKEENADLELAPIQSKPAIDSDPL